MRVGTKTIRNSCTKNLISPRKRPPSIMKLKSLRKANFFCMHNLRIFRLEHRIILAKKLTGTNSWIRSFSRLKVMLHELCLQSPVVRVDDLTVKKNTRLYYSFWRLKIVSYFLYLWIAFSARSGSESLNEKIELSFIFMKTS